MAGTVTWCQNVTGGFGGGNVQIVTPITGEASQTIASAGSSTGAPLSGFQNIAEITVDVDSTVAIGPAGTTAQFKMFAGTKEHKGAYKDWVVTITDI